MRRTAIVAIIAFSGCKSAEWEPGVVDCPLTRSNPTEQAPGTCPEEPVGTLDLDMVDSVGGCGDVSLTYQNEGGWLALSMSMDGDLIDFVYAEDARTTCVLDLPHTQARVSLFDNPDVCNDTYTTDAPVSCYWRATSGTIEMTVTPRAEDMSDDANSKVTVDGVLTDIVLENELGGRVEIPLFEWENDGVGWLPG